MANDEIRLLILFLQRRLEFPHLDVLVVSQDPCFAFGDEVLGVELGVSTLDYDLGIALRAQYVNDGVRECLLDKFVEAGRPYGNESVHSVAEWTLREECLERMGCLELCLLCSHWDSFCK